MNIKIKRMYIVNVVYNRKELPLTGDVEPANIDQKFFASLSRRWISIYYKNSADWKKKQNESD